MKRGLLSVFLLLVLLLPTIHAEEELPRYNIYDSLIVEGSVSNPITIVASSSKASIDSVTAEINWYPHVDSITTSPSSTQDGDTRLFKLINPAFGDHEFITYFTLENKVTQPTISPTSFPLQPVSTDLARYTKSQEVINIDDDIRALATSLSAGDDEFEVVVNLAKWVKKHVEYDLSTQAVEASQTSTWVLENRRGVCDEITNLFISMCRSLGIPARFVSGLSYTTNNAFENHWGPHGWAEVYFPGTGWVPFDVTYGQLGWVDSSHIVFSKTEDSGGYANSYSWLGRNVDVRPEAMRYEIDVKQVGDKLHSPLSIQTILAEQEVGKDSYNVVLAKITNRGTSMLAEDVTLGKTQGLQTIGEPSQVVSLAPQETKQLFWIVRVTETFDKGYEYKFPVLVYTSRGINDTALMIGRTTYQTTSQQWAESYAEQFSDQTTQIQTSRGLQCSTEKTIVRVEETFDIVCQTEEELCADDYCVHPKNGEAILTFSYKEAALHAVVLISGQEKTFMQITVVDDTAVVIKDVQAPAKLDYDEHGKIHFSVMQEKGLPLTSLDVELDGPVTYNSWVFDSAEERTFDIDITGDSLVSNPSKYTITLRYTDAFGLQQSVSEEVFIAQGEAAWWQRILWWLSKLTT